MSAVRRAVFAPAFSDVVPVTTLARHAVTDEGNPARPKTGASRVAREARRRIAVLSLRAEHLFGDGQGALVERPRSRKVALGLKQGSEVVQAHRLSAHPG